MVRLCLPQHQFQTTLEGVQTSQKRHLCMKKAILRRTIYWQFPGIHWDKQLKSFFSEQKFTLLQQDVGHIYIG